MIITTSQSIEGHAISEYLGIVTAAAVSVLPGNNKMMSRAWKTTVDGIVEMLTEQAKEIGADAVIAVNMQQVGSNLCATGTAVKFAS